LFRLGVKASDFKRWSHFYKSGRRGAVTDLDDRHIRVDCAPLKGGLCFIERLEELSVQARRGWAPRSRSRGAPPHVSTPLLPQQPTSSNAWSLPANVAWRTPKVRPPLIAYSPQRFVGTPLASNPWWGSLVRDSATLHFRGETTIFSL
jgi:hypothetical protein